ncbi:multidrug efflux SMR transporter [Alkalicoccobacillus gibsonii]|uniref:Multidrug efflux SMR transporter n=1 Tax=Alkalicoccobacillus gibsonii TaxID=79881 RepID=A0ABU9VEP1_9BACI
MKNVQWLLVIIAAIFEVGWATGLKYADSIGAWVLTIVAIIISFGLLIIASTRLPTSTVYAVFVGLGTVGTVLVDIFYFGAGVNVGLILFIALLVTGVIGLKFATKEKKEVERG